MPNFGKHTGRPGGEPPPRRQLTPDEIHVRETFNRADHLAGKGPSTQSEPRPEVPALFDEQQIRASLAQVGLDLLIFPLGEKPADPTGRNQYREGRLIEAEKEIVVLRERAVTAESTAAMAVREVATLKEQLAESNVLNGTLRTELENLKSSQPQEAA